MFKKVNCNNCKQSYDETFNECPNCHSPNGQLDPNFKNIQMLAFGKQLGLFLTGSFGFTILGVIISVIFSFFNTSSMSITLLNMILNGVAYGVLFIILFAIVNFDFKKLFNSFKNWKPYVAAICCFVAIIAFGMLYSFILQVAGVSITGNDNQQAIDVTSESYPVISLIIFGLIGPICEELTYRVGLFSFFKRINKYLAYAVTIIVFTLIHFNFDLSNLSNELLNLPYYIFAAISLTFVYDNFGFAGSTVAHILNNVISLIPASVILGVFH